MTDRFISLSNSMSVAIIDEADYLQIANYNFYLDKKGYAAATTADIYGVRMPTRLHIFLFGKNSFIDHIDRNRLNNRRNNFRNATRSQQAMNHSIGSNNSSGFKGVYKSYNNGKFKATIKKDYKSYHLGYFLTDIEAACAYNDKAIELFGEFAVLNKIPE